MTKEEKAEELEDEKQRRIAKKRRDKELKKYIGLAREENEARPGKPLILTWALLVEIRSLLVDGPFQKYVFQSLGINKTTWEYWKQQGTKIRNSIIDKELKYADLTTMQEKQLYLLYLVAQSKGKAVQRNIKYVENVAVKDWRAAAWYLKVIDNETFGDKIENTVKAGINMKSITDKFKARMDAEENGGE